MQRIQYTPHLVTPVVESYTIMTQILLLNKINPYRCIFIIHSGPSVKIQTSSFFHQCPLFSHLGSNLGSSLVSSLPLSVMTVTLLKRLCHWFCRIPVKPGRPDVFRWCKPGCASLGWIPQGCPLLKAPQWGREATRLSTRLRWGLQDSPSRYYFLLCNC